jgi:hypothetical protein
MQQQTQKKAPIAPVKSPEREMPKTPTARAFAKAANPEKEAERQALMRKDFEEWKRRRPRDDFERER